jgi:hypothetical protein
MTTITDAFAHHSTRVARAAAWSAQKMKKAARDAYWDDAAEAAGHDDDEGR